MSAAAISTAGILAIACFGSFVQRNSAYISAFAAGLLSANIFLHLLLEAMELSPPGLHALFALGWMAAGFTAMVLVGTTVQYAVNRSTEGAALTFGYASIIALSVHSFIDGIIYAAVFRAEPMHGWLATGGLLFHEFPEGVIAYFLLYQAGLGMTRSALFAFAAASITTMAGTVLANSILAMAFSEQMGAMLGGAAGALAYVLIFHLIPNAAKAPDGRSYLMAQLGVTVGAAAIIFDVLSGGH